MGDEFILLVEDNDDDVKLTSRALETSTLRHRLVVVSDGQEALDYLFGMGAHADRNCGMQPEVILLDVNLPKINGLEVLRRIRADERTRTLPVVVLTSSNEERDRMAASAHCANSYICKPVDCESFSNAVRQLGLYWLILKKAPGR